MASSRPWKAIAKGYGTPTGACLLFRHLAEGLAIPGTASHRLILSHRDPAADGGSNGMQEGNAQHDASELHRYLTR